MPTGTRHARQIDFPMPISTRGMTDPRLIELTIDSMMSATAARMGKDKCVRVGCMVLIEPSRNMDGFCQFDRRSRSGG